MAIASNAYGYAGCGYYGGYAQVYYDGCAPAPSPYHGGYGILSAGEGITDPRDNTVPLALLSCGIVNQHAVHEAARKITAVVPYLVIAEAGYGEEPWCHPLVYNVRGRVHLCKKHSR